MGKLFIYSFLFWFIFTPSSQAAVSLERFKEIVKLFYQEYDQELKNQKAIFVVNNAPMTMPLLWWNQEAPHASYSAYFDPDSKIFTHYLFLFGGFARLSFMNDLGIIMTLCHELGHGIGGAPYKETNEKYNSSVEGQSDYYAARYCFRRIVKYLPGIGKNQAPNDFAFNNCNKSFIDSFERAICYKSFEALEVERAYFLGQEGIQRETNVDTPDLSVASSLNLDPYFYPEAQCRLDTMINGVLNRPRPACWFP